MKKVIIYNDRWCSGGVESMIMNLLSHYDFSDVKIVILVGQKETCIYDDFLSKKGFSVIPILDGTVSNPIIRDIKVMHKLKKHFKSINPNLVHINVCNSIGFKYAKIAKKTCNCTTIVHSHNTKIEHDKFGIKKFAHWFYKHLERFSDINISCSKLAGDFMFNKNYIVLKNGVDLNRFKYDLNIRMLCREKYGYSDSDTVLLNVGRFNEQKNQLFLLDVLNDLPGNYKLLVVGEGPLKESFDQKVKILKLCDRVKVLEPTSTIENVYNLSDIFVLPSLHEGLPVVGIEAQANGLNCIFSSEISNEVIVTINSILLSIDDSKKWAEKIISIKPNRIEVKDAFIDKGYCIEQSSKKLHDIYLK